MHKSVMAVSDNPAAVVLVQIPSMPGTQALAWQSSTRLGRL
jgi:hypothetical protein